MTPWCICKNLNLRISQKSGGLYTPRPHGAIRDHGSPIQEHIGIICRNSPVAARLKAKILTYILPMTGRFRLEGLGFRVEGSTGDCSWE